MGSRTRNPILPRRTGQLMSRSAITLRDRTQVRRAGVTSTSDFGGSSPADQFLRGAYRLKTGQLSFVASMNPAAVKRGQPARFNEFLIEKRGLADAITAAHGHRERQVRREKEGRSCAKHS